MAPYGRDAVSFELVDGTSRFVRLKVRLRQAVRIFGDINGWQPGGTAEINGVPVAVTSKGRYEFKKAQFGINTIFVDVPRKALFRRRFEVKGRQLTRYNFQLTRAAKIRGIVSGQDRVRVEGAEVRVGIDFEDPRNEGVKLFPIEKVPVVKTAHKGDPDLDPGEFLIDRLEPGALYTVAIVKHPHPQFVGTFVAKTLGVHRIQMPSGPFLFGKLHGLGGVPRNAVVSARRLLRNPDTRQFNVPSWDEATSGRDRKGFYGLSGLLPDVYVIRADAPEYGSMETVVDLRGFGHGRLDLRVRKGSHAEQEDAELLRRLPPLVDGASATEEPRLADTTFLTIDAKRPGNAIPLPGVVVRFFEGGMEYRAPLSFTGEKFDLAGLQEGTYRLILEHPLLNRPLVHDRVKLVRGEPRTVEFRED